MYVSESRLYIRTTSNIFFLNEWQHDSLKPQHKIHEYFATHTSQYLKISYQYIHFHNSNHIKFYNLEDI